MACSSGSETVLRVSPSVTAFWGLGEARIIARVVSKHQILLEQMSTTGKCEIRPSGMFRRGVHNMVYRENREVEDRSGCNMREAGEKVMGKP